MDESLCEKALAWKEALEKACVLDTELANFKTDRQLCELATQVEAHISPGLRAQLLQADLALANSLRELVEVERAKANAGHFAKIESGKLCVRTTLYPDTPTRAHGPGYSGSTRLAGRTLSIQAWIDSDDAKFINIELSIL